MSGMRKLREKRHNRVYHLISRIAHRSFYLDADERNRCHMRPIELRDMLGIASSSYFTLRYLSPLAKAGYVELVDGGNKSSCRCVYRLTGSVGAAVGLGKFISYKGFFSISYSWSNCSGKEESSFKVALLDRQWEDNRKRRAKEKLLNESDHSVSGDERSKCLPAGR